MNSEDLFKQNLLEFEKTLNLFGYYSSKENSKSFEPTKHSVYFSIEQEYINVFLKRNLSISYNSWESGRITISLCMQVIDSEKSFFSLQRFLKKHNLQDKLTSRYNDGHFETFIKQYFESLKNIFENELNDQITGKSFENHWQEQMDEFNDRYR